MDGIIWGYFEAMRLVIMGMVQQSSQVAPGESA
jgi:hypothetical protein